MRFLKKLFDTKNKIVEVQVHCPDDYCEYVSFRLPSQLSEFIKHHNNFNKNGYHTKLYEFDLNKTLKNIKQC